jgi:uncharacterized protein (TIGR03000 family)
VNLPADATLTIDDRPTRSLSGERRFITPPLPADKAFRYVLKAEVVRDGRTLQASQDVTVRAGEESAVTLEPKAEGGAGK